ncbi:MAG: hypothetical protein D4R38_02680 [Dehalococcoidia bacterium]|nr:MAG: hypothetical protein D4R38_02680 [Dehalococcoidia bacterium]
MSDQPPETIPALWYVLDKRLALIEAALATHTNDRHLEIEKKLDDHEDRIRSGLGLAAILTGSGGFLALVALIRSFLP